jgi:glycosyltransferase involved in cell wall biosynthesis
MAQSASLGVIALVPDAWHDIVMPRHQVLRRLAKHFPVVWVEPASNWREYLRPGGPRFMSLDRWSEPVASLEVLSPGWWHPTFHRPRWLQAASFRSRLSLARRRLVDAGARQIGLYIWRDEFADALDLVEHDFSCYHVDDEYSFSDSEKPNSERELKLLKRVDQVIVHSPALMEKKGNVNSRTAMIPNGVNYRQFAAEHDEPADIAGIAHPRIGYAGVIKKQLDIGLLARLARMRPQYSFVAVGPVMNIRGKEKEFAEFKQLPNVHLLGGKPAESLASYVHHFDVCVMCYDVNDYTRYIYPLKLNEYLATGRPTVSSPIETVRAFADVVSIAGGDAEWLSAIDYSLTDAARTAAASEARRTVARGNDWELVVGRIADLFRSGATLRLSEQPARQQQGLAT